MTIERHVARDGNLHSTVHTLAETDRQTDRHACAWTNARTGWFNVRYGEGAG